MLLAVAAATTLFTLPAGLTEVSGMAYGGSGTLYVHEDSGSGPVVTALTGSGAVRARYDLGVDARDWEDMAAGPDGTLLLADTGDNRAVRTRGVLVHRLREPSGPSKDVTPTSFRLTYEDGPKDAEALLVHPRTGQVLVVTKAVLGQAAYAAPQPLAAGVLRKVADVRTGSTGTAGGPVAGLVAQRLVTGGAVSPDGRRVVLRTYTDAYVYDVPGDDLAAALGGEPVVVPLPASGQGEAVTWTRDGAALVITSEGTRQPVRRVALTEEAVSPSASAPAARPAPEPPTSGSGSRAVPVAAGTAAVVLLSLLLLLGRRRRRRP